MFIILLLVLTIDLQCDSFNQITDVNQFNKIEKINNINRLDKFEHFDRLDLRENQYGNNSVNYNDLTHQLPLPKRKPKNLIALIFSGRTKINPELSAASTGTLLSCKWLKGYRKQMQQCLERRGFAKVLQDARKLAVTQCRNLFSFDRWDCTKLQNSMFKKVHRETSFIQALSASALMFSIAKACSDGKLQSCYCLMRPKRENAKWHGVGCADNTKVARRITRRFLIENIGDSTQIGSKQRLKLDIYRNNINVGLETVEKHKKEVCVCHGVSASCTLKTCWKIINRNFTMIATSLKTKYNSAHIYKEGTLGSAEVGKSLIYLEESPNFCNMTRGRRCKDHNHCATLCCGRGSMEKNVVVNGRCNCKWNDDLVLGCEFCKISEVHFICK